MPIPRVRFTVRRMMVAAAVVAVVAWDVHARRLSWDYRLRAQDHAVAGYDSAVDSHCPTANGARARRLSEYHWLLHEKYKRAARYPWLAVAPDPPEPE